jgi:hypothetical protein
MQNQSGILMLLEDDFRLFPARQVKLPPPKGKKRNAAARQLLLKMVADESSSAGDENFCIHGHSL